MIAIMVGICLSIVVAFVYWPASIGVLLVFGLYGIGDELSRIEKHLFKLLTFCEWFKVHEQYRFGKQYPNAAQEWEDARRAAAHPPTPEPPTHSAFQTEVQPEYPSPTLPSSASGSKNPRSR